MLVKITQTVVNRQQFTTSGTRWLHDTELRGFSLAVGMTTRTFYAGTEYRGRLMRRKVGRSDVLTRIQDGSGRIPAYRRASLHSPAAAPAISRHPGCNSPVREHEHEK